MRIGVIGAGHVGLVTGVAMASLGHEVVVSDADETKVESMRTGTPPFFEAGLSALMRTQIEQRRVSFSVSSRESVAGAAIVFICVGRPSDGISDTSLSAVEEVAREVASEASDGVVVAEKSTVPPGTADRLRTTIERERPELRFSVVSNPEFLREGHAIDDTLRPTRVVIGADDEHGREIMEELYAPIVQGGSPIIVTDVRSAELAKLASNAFLATKISFANALARVAELSGADVEHVADVMGSDPRIGRAFLGAGLGYGGYCLPKDVVSLERFSERHGYTFSILEVTSRVNEEAVAHVTDKVREAMWNLEGKRIGLLGLAFKSETDDVRASPALELARRLIAEKASVVAHDPMASDRARAEMPDLETVDDPYAAASGANCVVICTDWDEYRGLDLNRLRVEMAYPIVVDGRNVFDPDEMRTAGISYFSIGRPSIET